MITKSTLVPRVTQVCLQCQTEFTYSVFPSQKKPRKFCSRQCANQAQIGKQSPFRGKQLHNEKSKAKLRLAAIRHVEQTRGRCSPNIGLFERELLDAQEKIDNCKILRQYPLRSLGYFVDGYDPVSNTVYEVYEAWHKKTEAKDAERQKAIQAFLNCDFKILSST